MVKVVVALLAKVLVWAEPVINILVEGLVINVRDYVLADVKIIMATIALKFAMAVLQSADVVIDVLIDTSTDVTNGVLYSIGVDVLTGVNINIFAVLMKALEFAVSAPSEGSSC